MAIGNTSVSQPAFNSMSGQEIIYYSLPAASNGTVTAVVVDAMGNVQRVINSNRQGSGRNSLAWDGKGANGSPAREGRYTIWLFYRLANNSMFSYGKPFSPPAGIDNVTVSVIVDNTPPNTSLSVDGDVGADGNYTTEVEASLAATDSLSGVNVTEYSLDGAPWSRYTGAIDIGDGAHVLAYRSTDRAGNVEGAKASPVNVSAEEAEDPDYSEDISPGVVYTSPADGDTDVPVDTTISVWFSVPVDRSSINGDAFRLEDQNGNYLSGTISYEDDAVVFTPKSTLALNSQYTAAIKDARSTNGTPMDEEYTWSFTTAEAVSYEEDDGDQPQNDTVYASLANQSANSSVDNATGGVSTDLGELAQSIDNVTGVIDNSSANVTAAPGQDRILSGLPWSPSATLGEYSALVLAAAFLAIAGWKGRRKK